MKMGSRLILTTAPTITVIIPILATLANNRVNKRLAELDMGQQQYIADKYYGGKMPWLKGGADNDC